MKIAKKKQNKKGLLIFKLIIFVISFTFFYKCTKFTWSFSYEAKKKVNFFFLDLRWKNGKFSIFTCFFLFYWIFIFFFFLLFITHDHIYDQIMHDDDDDDDDGDDEDHIVVIEMYRCRRLFFLSFFGSVLYQIIIIIWMA